LNKGQINKEDIDKVALVGFGITPTESYNLDPKKLIASKHKAFQKRKWESHVPGSIRGVFHPYLDKRYKDKEEREMQDYLNHRKKWIMKYFNFPES
jgi:hypothetical protein